MKKKILFVVNNFSGTVSQYNIPKCIDMFLESDLFESKVYFIDQEFEDNNYESKLDKGWDYVICVGGDGTLLELGTKLIERNITLGFIPIGSGNGLSTHLGYKPRDIESAFRAINAEKTKAIDIAQINDKYFFSNFGMGIDAKVAKDFKIKKKRSFLVYISLTLQRILKLKAKKIIYKIDDKEYQVSTYLFNVFNSNLYGYNVGLLPWANAFDGELDVVYLKSGQVWKLPWTAFCILIKKPQWASSIVFFKTKEITIVNHKPKKMGYQVDGDPMKSNLEDIQISVLPGRLNVIVP